jgi:hypothetical protein
LQTKQRKKALNKRNNANPNKLHFLFSPEAKIQTSANLFLLIEHRDSGSTNLSKALQGHHTLVV